MMKTVLFVFICLSCQALGCFTSLLDLHKRLHEISVDSNSTDPVLSSDSRIVLNGKLTKAKAEYQNPTSIQFRWFNLFDEDNNRETAWVHCGGKSVLSNDKFSLIDNFTIEEFDRSMTTMPQMISWYSEALGTTEEEIAKIKFAMGHLSGTYENDVECKFYNDFGYKFDKGPNEEVADAMRFAVFYRNGTFPNCDPTNSSSARLCKFFNEGWPSRIPQGFSCGKGVDIDKDFDEYVPVDCSEVEVKVVQLKRCSRNPELGNDCFNPVNWT